MIRVLHVTSELDGGGVDRLLYDYCSRMKGDIYFDFVVNSMEEGILEQPLKCQGFNVFRIKQIRHSLLGSIKEFYNILKNEDYDVVHVHSGYKAFIPLSIAFLVGVKVRIAHSHQAYIPEEKSTKFIRKIVTPFTKLFASHLFACGRDAALWMWGSKSHSEGKVFIMRNAIDTKKFKFSDKKRNDLKKDLKLDGKFVIGNVARFSYQKNHEFLIRAFYGIKKEIDNAILILVGRGELEDNIKLQIEQLNLLDSVILLGVRDDVPELLNAMDLFLLQSRYEGLPVTLVEVQANGLKSIVSDNITDEINITDIIKYVKLDESIWVKEVCDFKDTNIDRESYAKVVVQNGYDIDIEANKLKSKYLDLLHKR